MLHMLRVMRMERKGREMRIIRRLRSRSKAVSRLSPVQLDRQAEGRLGVVGGRWARADVAAVLMFARCVCAESQAEACAVHVRAVAGVRDCATAAVILDHLLRLHLSDSDLEISASDASFSSSFASSEFLSERAS